mgnify:CR=1 FL=1
MRHDTTVAETDIAHPVDVRLLSDSVRVMTRLLKRLRRAAPVSMRCSFHNRARAVKSAPIASS